MQSTPALCPTSHASRRTLQPQVDRADRGRRQQRQRILTFTRLLGHLELDEELLQLLSHGGRSDQPLVIQEVFLTPLRVLAVLRGPRAGAQKKRRERGASPPTTVSLPVPPDSGRRDLQGASRPFWPSISLTCSPSERSLTPASALGANESSTDKQSCPS